jgi:glutaredoxin
MKKIIFIVMIMGIVLYLKPDWFQPGNMKGAYDEQGNPKVMIFVYDKCGQPCNDAIKVLNRHRVNFEIYSVDESEANKTLWNKYGAVNSFPNIIIGDNRVYGSHRGVLVAALAENFGDSALLPAENFYMKTHFYDNGSPRLVLYGTDWCVFCKEIRQTLDEKKIDYLDIDVEKSNYRKDLVETMDINGYPLVYYGYKRLNGPKPKDILSLL